MSYEIEIDSDNVALAFMQDIRCLTDASLHTENHKYKHTQTLNNDQFIAFPFTAEKAQVYLVPTVKWHLQLHW